MTGVGITVLEHDVPSSFRSGGDVGDEHVDYARKVIAAVIVGIALVGRQIA